MNSNKKNSPANTFLPNTSIELVNKVSHHHIPKVALFDFDGTLSLIREGWMEIMVDMAVKELKNTGTNESNSELVDCCSKFIKELTGKQTIYQMITLADKVKERGGDPKLPIEYKHQYLGLLLQKIEARREGLRNKSILPHQFLVTGSIEILSALKERGCMLILASGTDHEFVIEEAKLLGIFEYFNEHIYGARDDYKSFSKAQIIQLILSKYIDQGEQLIGFGDGFVEIENVKNVGGTTIGLATDEKVQDGTIDMWKRNRLISAGADIIIPDFRHSEALETYLFQKS